MTRLANQIMTDGSSYPKCIESRTSNPSYRRIQFFPKEKTNKNKSRSRLAFSFFSFQLNSYCKNSETCFPSYGPALPALVYLDKCKQTQTHNCTSCCLLAAQLYMDLLSLVEYKSIRAPQSATLRHSFSGLYLVFISRQVTAIRLFFSPVSADN